MSLYAMCRQWVQNSVDVDVGIRPAVPVCHHVTSKPSAMSYPRMHLLQNSSHHCSPRITGCSQEVAALKLPPPLVASSDIRKDPPKEVALLQDEETLFLDEDTLPAEVKPP